MSVAVVAIFQDEARWLREWMEFHALVGVDHFLLYDNASVDNWHPEVAPFIESGRCDVEPWPTTPGQLSAYAHAINHYGHDFDWMAFIDIDEFLYSPEGLLIPEVLTDYEEFAGVAVNWRTFGTSDLTESPRYVVPIFNRAAEQYDPINRHVKSIVQPLHVHPHMHDPHHFLPVGEEVIVNTAKQPTSGPFNKPVLWDRLVVNHYMSKSLTDARNKAATRRSDNNELRPLESLTSDALNATPNTEIQRLHNAALLSRMQRA